MKNKTLLHITWFALASLFTSHCLSAVQDSAKLTAFINKMVTEHQFSEQEMKALFTQVDIKQSILKAISRPAEGMPWYKYRKIFMKDSRIDGGVKFWQENEETLQAVEEKYGVPPEIITAIIGVETLYGGNTGSFRVVDALSTLAFSYPKRSKFFTRELEAFLLLCREENMQPLQPKGSYAGAMGMPQFMPSSYRAYAADFEGDSKRDIWGNTADVIASVANYFVEHRWRKGEPVTYPVTTQGNAYKALLSKGLKPDVSIAQLQQAGIKITETLSPQAKAKLLAFEQENSTDYWLGLHNFYVITRYNHSPLYAMAVYQLSQAVKQRKHADKAE